MRAHALEPVRRRGEREREKKKAAMRHVDRVRSRPWRPACGHTSDTPECVVCYGEFLLRQGPVI